MSKLNLYSIFHGNLNYSSIQSDKKYLKNKIGDIFVDLNELNKEINL